MIVIVYTAMRGVTNNAGQHYKIVSDSRWCFLLPLARLLAVVYAFVWHSQ